MCKVYRNCGFTLIEVILVIAILAIITSATIFGINAKDKIATAEVLALQQILIVQIPKEIQKYYVRNNSSAWTQRLAEIQVEMEQWPGLDTTKRKRATVYDGNGLMLQFETQYGQSINAQLRATLKRSPMVVSINSASSNQLFKIRYRLN